MYTLVKKIFTSEGETDYEYDAIPSSWVINAYEMKYPTGCSAATILKMATNGEKVGDAYEVVSIEICKSYKSFDEAYGACVRKTRNRRSKSSSEEEEKGRGLRIKKRKIFSDPETSSSDEDVTKAPKRPKTVAKKNCSEIVVKSLGPPPKPPQPQPTISKSKPRMSCVAAQLLKTKSKPNQHQNEKSGEKAGFRQNLNSKPVSPLKTKLLMSRVTPLKTNPNQWQNEERGETTEIRQENPDSQPASPSTPRSFMLSDGPSDLDTPRSQHLPPTKTPPPDSGHHATPNKSVKRNLLQDFTRPLRKVRCKLGKKTKHLCPLRLKCSGKEAILHALCALSGEVLFLRQEVKKLRCTQGDKVNIAAPVIPPEWGELDLPQTFTQTLPLETDADVTAFEEILKVDKSFEIFKKRYCFECQNDPYISKTARNIARDIIAPNLLTKYSLKGGHSNVKNSEKKKSFKSLRIFHLILAVVRKLWGGRFPDYKELTDKSLGQMLIDTKIPSPA